MSGFSPFVIICIIFKKKHTQSAVKNRKNDRSDASLQVDPLGDVRESRSGALPPIREGSNRLTRSPGLPVRIKIRAGEANRCIPSTLVT